MAEALRYLLTKSSHESIVQLLGFCSSDRINPSVSALTLPLAGLVYHQKNKGLQSPSAVFIGRGGESPVVVKNCSSQKQKFLTTRPYPGISRGK